MQKVEANESFLLLDSSQAEILLKFGVFLL